MKKSGTKRNAPVVPLASPESAASCANTVDPSLDTKKLEKEKRDQLYHRARMIAREYLARLELAQQASFEEIAEDVLKKTGQDLRRGEANSR